MKTSYLLRNCPWLSQDERRTARYIARHAQATLSDCPTTAMPLATCAVFALATGHALYQRAQQRVAEALGPQGDPAHLPALAQLLAEAQAMFLAANQHVALFGMPGPRVQGAAPAQEATAERPPCTPNSFEGNDLCRKAGSAAAADFRKQQADDYAVWSKSDEGRKILLHGCPSPLPPRHPDSHEAGVERRKVAEAASAAHRAELQAAYDAHRAATTAKPRHE